MEKINLILQRLSEYAKINNVPIVSQEAADIVVRTIEELKPHNILELGTAIGYSTLLIAASMPADGKIVSVELDEMRTATAREAIEAADMQERIRLLSGDAKDVLQVLNGKFDMVFIDAAKAQYPYYLEKVKPLLTDEACIIADNVLFRGWVEGVVAPPRRFRTIVKRLRAYLQAVTTEPEYTTALYRIGDGVAVTRFKRGQDEYEEN